MRFLVISLLSALAFSLSAVAIPCGQNAETPCPEFERLRIDGNHALYNLDYQKARDAFQEMIELEPNNPAGFLYLGNNLWLEILNKSRRLSSSLYSSASFYTQTGDNENVDQDRERQFNAFIKRAIEVAEARLKINPKDVQALYYKGAAVGVRAAYRVTVKRKFMGAIGDGKESLRIQKKVITLDPNYTDANLSIGFYEYVVDSLPWGWKIGARFVGITGSKKTGIELLQKVVKSGKYASDDARVLLIGIYTREGRFEQAKELIDYLAGKYPRNYLLGIESAAMLYRMGRVADGARAFEVLLKDEHIVSVATDVVNYQNGEALIGARDYISAAERYRAVINWPRSDKSLVTLAHLRAGQAFDALGRRADALNEYKLVLQSRIHVYDADDLARKYQRKPYLPSRK
jgi:tetratricopeptide (TPR) repeat protein